ncbi:Leucine-rich repeat 2 [Arabidopsis thaliana x Arabidopsis arenosa]|uniref:Leucine-rich repeat 2 n=1 Tax=Arabidopsis thaliana x Arabidopsis arenosa TaxID=1240361 RepID=A0A8T1Y9R0_9BRAS|nr:Leucine-rich repeat 2 [Arabidopsis thaliana x Arabidopsis arenosa]
MGSRDFISSLPDEVLGKKILSLLPTKLVVSTSVLSKRWRNLFHFVDNFDLEDSTSLRNDGFSDFMEKTVALLSNCPIKRLTLNCHYEQSSVDHWIRSALERGCLELNLQSQYAHSLDIGIFSRNNTLVKLTLSSFRTFVQGNFPPDGTVFFPALKTLSLGAVVADPALYNWLISGCPVLEELLIRDVGDGDDDQPTWTRSVVSASIKRLTIYFHYPLDTYPYEDDVEIKTPNLEFLDYSALLSDGSDVDYLDSLAEARLDLRLWELPTTGDFGDITNLVAAIRNVKTLHLSPGSLEAFYYCCYTMPVFDKLLHLSIESDKENGWQALPRLLLKSPNLQTLAIKGLVHKVTYRCGSACACTIKPKKKYLYKRYEDRSPPSEVEGRCCLWTCRVKVLEISGYGGSSREVKQMEHFLGKLKYLETVKIGVEEDNNSEYLRANLMTLARASSKCNIQFI